MAELDSVTHLCMHMERETAVGFLCELAKDESDLRNRLGGSPSDFQVDPSDVRAALAEWGVHLPLEDIPKRIELPSADEARSFCVHFSNYPNPFGHWVFVVFLAVNRP